MERAIGVTGYPVFVYYMRCHLRAVAASGKPGIVVNVFFHTLSLHDLGQGI